MMAARSGATAVTACEAHTPMVPVARDVVAANGYAEQIRIHGKHSSELTTIAQGDIGDLPMDIIVSEILDSELLGEGVLSVMRDCLARGIGVQGTTQFIPCAATVYAQLIESDDLYRHHAVPTGPHVSFHPKVCDRMMIVCESIGVHEE